MGPASEARPPSRTMPIAAFSALPPAISSKWPALTLKPREGSSWMRKVRSRTGMPMHRMRGGIFGAAAWKFMGESIAPVRASSESGAADSTGCLIASSSSCARFQPLPEQMVRDRERMRRRQAVRVLPLLHQHPLRAREPARLLQFRAIDDDVLIQRPCRAADHQRRRIGPGLRHVIVDVGAANPGFLENLAAHRVLDGFRRLDEAGKA